MPWIESHTGLERHPKLLIFKSKMRWSKNEAIGFLHRFWWTVLEYAPDGVISALSPVVMSETLDMTPENLALAFTALEEAQFLRRDGDKILVHDWLDYAGRYLTENKYRRKPERMAEIINTHRHKVNGDTGPPMTCPGQAKAPHQPTNQPTTPARGGDQEMGDARRFAQAWVTANAPSFLRSFETFARLVVRLGKADAEKQVREAMAKPDVGNPFTWLEGKLDKLSAARSIKAEQPKRAIGAREDN
jgi:hypothetical protein